MRTPAHKPWLTLLLIFLFNGINYGQTTEADKLRLQIVKETNDTVKINLLVKLGLNYAENDSLAIIYLKEAYELSVKKNYSYGLAFGQYYKVLQLTDIGKYDD